MAVNDYSDLYQAAGKHYGIDPNLLMAQGEAESSGNPNAVGPDTPYGNAQGIAQLIPATASSLGVTDPYDPKQAIDAQARLMAENMKRYKDQRTALLAYHGGTNKANWGSKTNNYADKVLATHQKLLGQQQLVIDPVSQTTQIVETRSDADNEADPMGIFLPGSFPPESQNTQDAAPSVAEDDDEDPFALADKIEAQRKAAAGVTTTPVIENDDDEDPFALADKLEAQRKQVREKAARKEVGPEWLQNIGKVGGKTADFVGNKVWGGVRALGDEMTPLKMAAIIPSMAVAPAMTAVAKASTAIPYVGAAARTLAGIVPEGAGIVPELVTRAVSGGVQGAITNTLMGGDATEGAESGAVVNTALGAGGQVIKPLFNALTGYGRQISPEVARLAKNASEKYGISIPGGLLSKNPIVNRTYSMLDRFGMTPKNENMANFTRAVSKEMGGNTNKLTREAMYGIKENIGKMYDEVAEKTPFIKFDEQLLNKLGQIEQNTAETLIPVGDSRIKLQIDKLLNIAAKHDGQIPISTWKDFTNSSSTLRALSKEGGTVGTQASEMRDALRSALENSAPKEELKKLRKASEFYKNYKVVQANAEKSPVTGELNPLSIANQVTKTTNKFGGGGITNLQELGDIGRQLPLTPSSGTAENYLLAKGGALLGNAAVGGAGYALGGLPAMAGAWTTGKLAGSYLSGDGYRNRLIKSALQDDDRFMKLLGYSPAFSNIAVGANQVVNPSQ